RSRQAQCVWSNRRAESSSIALGTALDVNAASFFLVKSYLDMNRERLNAYVWSIPERLVRAGSALAGGAVRGLGEVGLPKRVRRTRLYQSLVDSTLRFLIEQVGQVDGAYTAEGELPKDFLIRRAAGNAIEIAGIVAFRASPVWVLAVLADASGAGRELIAE